MLLLQHLITLSDTNTYSIGLLWTSDRPAALDKTQHLQQTDTHAVGGIRSRNSSKRAPADLRPVLIHHLPKVQLIHLQC